MLCTPLPREAGSVPSMDLECKPSSTFSLPHLPSSEGLFCASHLPAAGSHCLKRCLGAGSLLGAKGLCALLHAQDAAAPLVVTWHDVPWTYILWWQVLMTTVGPHWLCWVQQLDRLLGHLSPSQPSAGVPAGFLKCKLQLQCDTHPFSSSLHPFPLRIQYLESL